jgi:hypothetical protein
MKSTPRRVQTEYRHGAFTWVFLSIGAFFGTLLFLLLVFPSVGGFSPGTLPIRIALVVIFVVGFDTLVWAAHPTRWIEFDSRTVTFGYPLSRSRVAWDQLLPGPDPVERGWWYIRSPRRFPLIVSYRSHALTVSQARLLLAQPVCPKWEISPTVATSLSAPPPETVPKW